MGPIVVLKRRYGITIIPAKNSKERTSSCKTVSQTWRGSDSTIQNTIWQSSDQRVRNIFLFIMESQKEFSTENYDYRRELPRIWRFNSATRHHGLMGRNTHHSSLPAEIQGKVHLPLHQALPYITVYHRKCNEVHNKTRAQQQYSHFI
jgi:hypothetical protein